MGLFGGFDAIAKAVRGAAEQLRALRDEIENLRRKRDEIEGAPAARADVKAEFGRYVKETGAAYVNALAGHAAKVSTQMHKLAGEPNSARDANFFAIEGRLQSNRPLDGLLCALAPELVLTMFARAVDEAPWPGPEGLRRTTRAVEVAKLDKRIAELLAQERELAAEARKVGIVLQED